LNKKGQLTATASPAQPRRPEILRLATATAFYGGGGKTNKQISKKLKSRVT